MLYQVNTVSPNPSLNTLLHIVTTVPGVDVRSVHKRRIGRTGIGSNRHPLHSSHAQHGSDKTLFQPSASSSTSSSSLLQFCPPRLKHSLQLRKLLECGSCSMSPLCVVSAIQTSEIHGNSVGTKQQLMASVKTRHQRLLWNCGSHMTKRRLRHEQNLK